MKGSFILAMIVCGGILAILNAEIFVFSMLLVELNTVFVRILYQLTWLGGRTFYGRPTLVGPYFASLQKLLKICVIIVLILTENKIVVDHHHKIFCLLCCLSLPLNGAQELFKL